MYLYKIATEECVRLPDLSVGRHYVTLYCYRDYLYAFSGIDCVACERYDFTQGCWERMQDMTYSRQCLACVGIENKIYLFWGNSKDIEVFDIDRLEFSIVYIENFETSDGIGVACYLNGKVYLMTDNMIQVYNSDLTWLNSIRTTFVHKHYTVSSLIRNRDCIYFLSNRSFTVQKVSTIFDNYYSNNYDTSVINNTSNRYLYMTVDNCSELLRLDCKQNTMVYIDCA